MKKINILLIVVDVPSCIGEENIRGRNRDSHPNRCLDHKFYRRRHSLSCRCNRIFRVRHVCIWHSGDTGYHLDTNPRPSCNPRWRYPRSLVRKNHNNKSPKNATKTKKKTFRLILRKKYLLPLYSCIKCVRDKSSDLCTRRCHNSVGVVWWLLRCLCLGLHFLQYIRMDTHCICILLGSYRNDPEDRTVEPNRTEE